MLGKVASLKRGIQRVVGSLPTKIKNEKRTQGPHVHQEAQSRVAWLGALLGQGVQLRQERSLVSRMGAVAIIHTNASPVGMGGVLLSARRQPLCYWADTLGPLHFGGFVTELKDPA